ncbi:hypothetical protein [Pseudarthrobacter sp. BIM B-2242]|uniref:hypothetical protein n=1 Tax=Pseudarthrobacter sp. BIM B-2242 TaxID=2772401 RepID=UPI00168B05B7|nr:hypothetical protein [Pseudarthrobacter sp. BIM B-2242]QOD05951.1 hypothetical protein IDT60_20495 [Pseudarthrobacter sp. BIM B-2242]
MSLRLNKAIGYALPDLVPNDPRINQESPLLNWPRLEEENENFVTPSFEGYIAWLKEAAAAGASAIRSRSQPASGFGTNIEATLLQIMIDKARGTARLTDAVIYQRESGPDILLLIPPVYIHSWLRRDDSIDYAEARLQPGGGLDNKLVRTDVGFGAYSTRFMDDDGTDLSSTAAEFVQFAEAGMPSDELDRIARDIRPLDWKFNDDRQLYAGAAEASARIVPTVPSDLRRLSAYGQLFTSDDVWKQLRPVLYTYWS